MVTAVNKVDVRGIGMTSQRTRERLVQRLAERGIRHQGVLDVMRMTPRHLFLDEAMAHRAYEDCALPIGFNQTISQPYIVALMTQLALSGGRCKRVLEVGTGCGYQTAVLAQLADEVYTIERIKPLQERARRLLRSLKLRNVRYAHGDGFNGWPGDGGFDAIVTTAAPQRIPDPFLAQLNPGGRLVIPVGEATQELRLVINTPEGFKTDVIEAVRFVPLVPGVQR